MTIDAAKFEQYLKEEGLEKISRDPEEARRRGEAGDARSFSRCAKALLLAGDAANPGRDRALGLTLELVAEKDPYALGPGGELPVRLLLEGKPLAGALVEALLHGDPAVKVSVAHRPAGARVAALLARQGFWLIKAVDMSPAPGGSRRGLAEPLGLVNL